MSSDQRRRNRLLDDEQGKVVDEKLTATEHTPTGTSQNITGATDVVSVSVASGDQVRMISQKWVMHEQSGSARFHAVASVDSETVLDRDYLSGAGAVERSGQGWKDPYYTHRFSNDGSLIFRAHPEVATVSRVAVSAKFTTEPAVDDRRL